MEPQELLDPNGEKLLKNGSAWQVQAGSSFGQPALLVNGYSKAEPWITIRQKLGMYQYDAAVTAWIYIGGITATV